MYTGTLQINFLPGSGFMRFDTSDWKVLKKAHTALNFNRFYEE
jgi:hypothetical protein